MRGRLLGLLLVSIPLGLAAVRRAAGDCRRGEAITLIVSCAPVAGRMGYFSRAEAQYRRALAIVEQDRPARGSPDLTPAH
jgi:hypothetical protein